MCASNMSMQQRRSPRPNRTRMTCLNDLQDLQVKHPLLRGSKGRNRGTADYIAWCLRGHAPSRLSPICRHLMIPSISTQMCLSLCALWLWMGSPAQTNFFKSGSPAKTFAESWVAARKKSVGVMSAQKPFDAAAVEHTQSVDLAKALFPVREMATGN